MKWSKWRHGTGLLVGVALAGGALAGGALAGGALAGSAAASGPDQSASTVAKVTRTCDRAVLTLSYAGPVSPRTGEDGTFYKFVNHGRRTCTLKGYPRVTLYAGKTALPFHYRDHGQYVTTAPPATVTLRPGAAAWFLVAKYRCDLGTAATATRIRLSVSGESLTGDVTPRHVTGAGFGYCRGGVHDPGQTVEVSPIEPRQTAAY